MDQSFSSALLLASPQHVIPIGRSKIEEGQPNAKTVALIGTYYPRKCGIATFTKDISDQLGIHCPDIHTQIYALDMLSNHKLYSGCERMIDCESPLSYAQAAHHINSTAVDAVWLQHEFGIFGGPDGEIVCDFVDRIAAPLIVTFHTVLERPTDRQRKIIEHLVSCASRIMVMSSHGRDLLTEDYHAPASIVELIPHGAPDRPFGRVAEMKARLDLSDKNVLMTFGLIGPGKGLENAIEALPAIIERHPNTVYRIVGATHPNLVREHGEAYREGLMALAGKLGVSDHVIWDNRFLDTDELLDQLEACDIYLTPYFNMQQATSGTLSYAVALGKAIVSTPYVHARELLADGAGILVEPRSSKSIATAVSSLLEDPAGMNALQRRAYDAGRDTIWPCFAQRSRRLIQNATKTSFREPPITATPSLEAVFAMSDFTGMLQHSIGIVPDRRHGYCLDDNARALILINSTSSLAATDQRRWSSTFASFIQHAWNPEKQMFRNFMNFDRTWCEDVGSEDSYGRALWALGHTAAAAQDRDLRAWGLRWFNEATPGFAAIDSPRALAFGMLGACRIMHSDNSHKHARALLERGGTILAHLLDCARRPNWAWFEAVLGYDNPRLAQALMGAGVALNHPEWVEAGLETQQWIAKRTIAAEGHFRPVGSHTFHKEYEQYPFDQQPLEAQAAIEASASAFAVSGDQRWVDHAMAAYRWYFGANDRGGPLADLATGRCFDGVTPRGVNENCGAESILAFHLAHVSLIALLNDARPNAGEKARFERTVCNKTASVAHS